MEHSNAEIESAIVCGNVFVKLSMSFQKDNFENWIQTWIFKCKTDFGRLCLTTGCLNHGPNEENLLENIFDIVLNSCQHQSSHTYQSFQALKLWSLKAKQNRKLTFLQNDKVRLQNLLDLINAHWENPLRGVSGKSNFLLLKLFETNQNILFYE